MTQNIALTSTRAGCVPARRRNSAYSPIVPSIHTSGVANAICVGISSAMKAGRKSSTRARPICLMKETQS